MSYRLLYDNQILFDPYTDDTVTDASMSLKTNAVAYFDFTIGPQHSLYNVIAKRAGKVELYFDDIKLYSGKIIDITTDMECYKSASCNGVLDYLSDTVVRPYSTVSGEQSLTAPSSVDGFFQWLIDQHNSNCLDSDKMFRVGVNQGAMLDKNNYIYRSSEQRPTTASEIEDKILNSLGGYLFVRYDGDSNILDFYADAHEANTQIIDFGVNITDFSKTETSADLYTVVIATGYTPDPPEGKTDVKMKPITLEGCSDGGTSYPNIIKMGDKVYDIDAVQRYGYREYYVSNTDITTYDGLLDFSCRTLNSLTSPQLSIDVKAVDLALYMKNGYEHLQLGQAVRVRSKPHNVDEYLMVNAITLDLQDPGNTEYELGVSYDTLTGQQSAFLKSLNASINSSLDTVSALGDDVKKTAKTAQEAKDTADEANNNATEANTKAETANTVANEAKDAANDAQVKADEATSKSNEAMSASKDASDKAAEAAKKADDATAKTELIENTLTEISGDTAQAIANAKKAQDAADAAKTAADTAQASADANATEVGKVKSQVESINTEIADVKSDATKLRNDLSGQITTVKNTMEADYSRKSDLTDTTETLRNEISESAAGVLRTVSTDYATKSELKTTTDATNKNAQDLTTAIKKFDGDINSLQGQIDGSIQTWFYEVAPTDKNEPAVNWTTTDLKNVHLGDLYYDTVTGYCYRYQVQNRVYSWQRITDVDVTKALADAAKAQDTADHKRRVFVSTPTTPYDVGDLWVQGTSGDILRCSVAKTSAQSYAAADWVKASKYTDDSAVTTLSNLVEKTYSTKSEVKQLSDTVSSTVSSVETIRVNAEAAQTSADNAKAAADAAQKAADAAKTNASTAQSTADAAKKNLETAQKNLETLQKQANATDEQLATAKANVEKAQKAANDAQTAADTAKTDASTAQATADAAKTAAGDAQKDVDSLKSRVTSAETSIKQNSDAIALRATKTEVTNAVNNISVGGRNLILDTGNFVRKSETGNRPRYDFFGSLTGDNYNGCSIRKLTIPSSGTVGCEWYVLDSKPGELYTFSFWVKGTCGTIRTYFYGPGSYIGAAAIKVSHQIKANHATAYGDGNCDFTVSDSWQRIWVVYELNPSGTGSDKYILIRTDSSTVGKDLYIAGCKLEKGNKPTDWSPAPEDLESDATTKANNALSSAKTYTDTQLKITNDNITSSVSKTYATKSDLNSTISNLTIGGTNLIRNSNVPALSSTEYGWRNNGNASSIEAVKENDETVIKISRNGTPTDGYLPSVVTQWVLLEWGKEYIASIDIKIGNLFQAGTVTPFHFHFVCSDSSDPFLDGTRTNIGTVVLSPQNQLLKANTWYHFTYTIKCPSVTPDSTKPYCKIRFFLYGKNNGTITQYNTAYLKNAKLEIGNKATDWSPAPEDYLTSTETRSAIKQSADSITSSVASTYQTISGMDAYAKSSEVKQTTDGLSLSITKVDDRTSSLETLIRATDSGIEIAKKVDGTYSGTKNLLTNTGMSIVMEKNSKDVEVASFRPAEINLGSSTTGASINMAQHAVSVNTYSAKIIKQDLNGAVTSAGSTMTCGRLIANRSLTVNSSTCGTSIISVAPNTTYKGDSDFIGSNFVQQTSKDLQYNSIYTLNTTNGGFTKVEQSQNSDGEIVNIIASSSPTIADETATDKRTYLSVSTIGGTTHIDMASESTSIISDSVYLNTNNLYKSFGKHALYGIRTLYNTNSTPAVAPVTVTISGVDLDVYDYIEIFGMTSETTQDSVKIRRPVAGYHNAKFSLVCYNGTGTNVYLKMTRFTITGSSYNWTFTPSEYNELYHGGGVNTGIGPSITRIDAYL